MPIVPNKKKIVKSKKPGYGKNHNDKTININDVYAHCMNERGYCEQIPFSKFKGVVLGYIEELIKMVTLTGKKVEISKNFGSISVVKRKLTGAFTEGLTVEEMLEKGYYKRDYQDGSILLHRETGGHYYMFKWHKARNINFRYMKFKLVPAMRKFIKFMVLSNLIHSQNEFDATY